MKGTIVKTEKCPYPNATNNSYIFTVLYNFQSTLKYYFIWFSQLNKVKNGICIALSMPHGWKKVE